MIQARRLAHDVPARRLAFPVALLLALFLSGCGANAFVGLDGGAGSLADAGENLDAGTPDAGAELDAGSTRDSGSDAGSDLDAGTDAGANMDAGADSDAGTELDAGSDSDAGESAAAACMVRDMTQIYAGALPPNPYGTVDAAGTCAAAHDVIVLLGCPSNTDGTASPSQIARADLAVALQAAGYADRFIVSGAAVHNQYVEADALAALLEARGVPAGKIWRDTQAMHTDENLYYSDQIMAAQGWTTAIVVSDDPGQFTAEAICDSNCCVEKGRLTLLDFPAGVVTAREGHYVRYPEATQVSSAECTQIELPTKAMCTLLSSRRACAGNLQLPP